MLSTTNNIFFILTYPENYNGYLELSTGDPGYRYLRTVHSKKINYNKQVYLALVYAFNFIPKKLKRDKETDKYSLNIILKEKSILSITAFTYKGSIEFKEIRNNFIYNLKFENSFLNSQPPTSLYTLSKIDKIKLYEEALLKLQSEPGDSLSNEFSADTIDSIIKDKIFDIECFLNLLVYCHTTKKIIDLLKQFKIENCEFKKDINVNYYSPVLDKIESEPEKYTKHSNKNDEIISCTNNFYDLLLVYRMHYEKYKLKILLKRKELWNYYAEKINFNEQLFPLVSDIEEEFIKIIMKQQKLSFELIKEIIYSLNTFEKIILFIENYLDIIKGILKKEEFHKMVRSNSSSNLKNIDKNLLKNINDLPTEKLRNNLNAILKQKKNRKYQFILFDNEYWDENFKFDKIKLFLINDSLIICEKNSKKFKEFKARTNYNISKLNNKEILNYLRKDIDNYDKMNYVIYYYKMKPFSLFNKTNIIILENANVYTIFDNIKLNGLDEGFFKKWNIMKEELYNLRDIRYNLNPKDIIERVNNMNDFELILKLFYIGDAYNNNINYEKSYEKKLVNLLFYKLLYLIENNIINNNIHQNASFILNLLIEIYEEEKEKNYYSLLFMEKIESIIPEKIIIYEIYKLFSATCKNIPNVIINHMADYLINQKEISIIKQLNNIKNRLISSMLFKIDHNINEKILYDNNNKLNNYFQLLKKFEEEKIVQNYLLYIKDLVHISEILDNINNGKPSFQLINSIFNNYSNKKIFQNKLSILLFNDKKREYIYINKITNYLNTIKNEIKYIKESIEINKEFYKSIFEHKDEDYLLKKILDKIEKGNLNIIYDIEIKKDLDKIHKIFPDTFKRYIMKNSLYFKHELTCNREHYKNVEEIFVQMKEDFEELKLLFEKNWESKIMREKILKYYNEIYKNDKNLLKGEIKVLMNYHDVYITDQEIIIIIDKIFLYYLKQSNLYNINYCLNLIQNETESYFKEYKTILLEMKEMIRYKDFDELSVKTKASDCDKEKSEKEK